MLQLTFAEKMLHTATRLQTYQSGKEVASGTGFFFDFKVGDFVFPSIVTNKHVLEGSDQVVVTCHYKEPDDGPSEKVARCRVATNPQTIVNHPDPDVDLCVIPFGPILGQAEDDNNPLFYLPLDDSVIPATEDWERFDAIEEVVMVGCPRGLFDNFNNLPLMRRGITSTPLGKRYLGKDEFMVDMACFPGSSGSPIFVYNPYQYSDRRLGGTIHGERVLFVGILYSGPTVTNRGEIVLGGLPRVEVAAMMHLGQAIRSSQLRAMPEVISARWHERPQR
ncbi:S1 family peptidase [Cereibacter johrii]|uniref:S1 family peptidase n=1 Tax=Cereibacter johrii TaxID=445629 RepID=UPI00167CBBEF|nr:serine protease [Cereibacter johrii]